MKEQRALILARNKRMENYLKLGEVGKTVNFELKKENKMKDVFRNNFKLLDQYTIDTISSFKEKAEHLLHDLEVAEAVEPEVSVVDRRCMALAKTNLEQAIMWAVKAIT